MIATLLFSYAVIIAVGVDSSVLLNVQWFLNYILIVVIDISLDVNRPLCILDVSEDMHTF